MLTILFFILFFGIFGKLIFFSIRATWSIAKIILFIVFLPVILLGLFIAGFVTIAFPLLIIVGIVALIRMLLD